MDRPEKLATPRIVYLPSGKPVVVIPPKTPRGRLARALDRQVPIELSRLPLVVPPDKTVPISSAEAGPSYYSQPRELLVLHPQPAEQQVSTTRRSPSPPSDLISPVTVEVATPGDEYTGPFRQGVPPRKPHAGAKVGTPYAMPWPGPDYQPDEAERARAARGEAQAQWMSVYDVHMMAREQNKTLI